MAPTYKRREGVRERTKNGARAVGFSMRMSGAEMAQLDAVAAHYGLSRASLVRFLLKENERNMMLAVAADLQRQVAVHDASKKARK